MIQLQLSKLAYGVECAPSRFLSLALTSCSTSASIIVRSFPSLPFPPTSIDLIADEAPDLIVEAIRRQVRNTRVGDIGQIAVGVVAVVAAVEGAAGDVLPGLNSRDTEVGSVVC